MAQNQLAWRTFETTKISIWTILNVWITYLSDDMNYININYLSIEQMNQMYYNM